MEISLELKKEIEPVHKALLLMYKEFLDICLKNKIKFTAIGGTAIGAIRNSGFIPWDDDIDVVLDEENHDLLVEIIKKHKYFSVVDYNGKNSVPIFKIYDTRYIIETPKGMGMLFLDVFKGFKERKLSNIKRARLETYNYFIHIKNYKIKYLIKDYGKFFIIPWILIKAIPLTQKYMIKKWNKIIKKSKIISDKTIIYFGYWLKYNMTDEVTWYKFEDTLVPVYNNFENDTYTFYGDIRKMPKKIPTQSDHGIKIISSS